MTREQVVDKLRLRQGNRQQKELASEIGISQQYLSDVYQGLRSPGKKILTYLGLIKSYEKARDAK